MPLGSFEPAINIDQQTESNHDTALTLAATGGHDELVELLITHGANIEHRDKKGCTPLILAATGGHAITVAILLDHSADIESQSDRTKDTALSLACSGGKQEVSLLLFWEGGGGGGGGGGVYLSRSFCEVYLEVFVGISGNFYG